MSRDATLLLADIGGTHARFVLYGGGDFKSAHTKWLALDYPDLPSALDKFLRQELPDRSRLDGIAVCAAGPVKDGRVDLTNSPWIVDARALAEVTGVADPLVVNDFTAMAMGVLAVGKAHHLAVGGGTAQDGRPIAVLGPGTGLGVSGLIPDGRGRYIPLSGEGGHIDLAPSNEREISILLEMMHEDPHISAEDVLSGPGLESLHMALTRMDGRPTVDRVNAADIAKWARAGSSPLAVEAVARFTRWLGAVAGDVTLILGAQGGVYLTGGILPKWGPLFDHGLFREGFEAKGRFRGYMQPIPVTLVTGGEPAMHGLAALWQQEH